MNIELTYWGVWFFDKNIMHLTLKGIFNGGFVMPPTEHTIQCQCIQFQIHFMSIDNDGMLSILSIIIWTMIMCVQSLYICIVGYKLIFQYSPIEISQNATTLFETTCDL